MASEIINQQIQQVKLLLKVYRRSYDYSLICQKHMILIVGERILLLYVINKILTFIPFSQLVLCAENYMM
jgi:hypothetical protein